jgi:hypothetical protein
MFQRLARALLILTAAPTFAQTTVPVSSPKLVYTTYAGTGPNSVLYAFAVDSAGYSYIGGSGPGSGSSGCAYLTKLNQTGTAAVWSICLEVLEVDGAAVDASGYIYVVAGNADRTSSVMKLSPDGRQTLYSTQIAGYSVSIAVDAAGDAYIAGGSDPTFKATSGSYMTSGGQAFAAKLNAAGFIEYATYLDLLSGRIAVDSEGQVWVVGSACPEFHPPNCDTSTTGTASAIRNLDASGAHLLVSNTFGGLTRADHGFAYYDTASGVAVDGADSVWVVGTTQSGIVPTTPDALEPESFLPGPLGRSAG